MNQHNFQLAELENMLPWEREIYITLLTNRIKEENERKKQTH